MTRDGHVVVVDQYLDVDLLADAKARSLRVVAFHLTSVRSEHHDRLARIRQGDAIAECPEVPEAPGAELHAGGQHLFWMSGQSTVVFAVMQQLFGRHGAIEHAEQILRRDSMPCLIVKDRDG